MLRRPIIGLVAIVVGLGAAWCWWPRADRSTQTGGTAASAAVTASASAAAAASPAPFKLFSPASNTPAPAYAGFRLSNTAAPLGQLLRRDSAVLLENARIDTTLPLNLQIPAHLRAAGEPGAYIVQARGPVNDAFRARLQAAGVS